MRGCTGHTGVTQAARWGRRTRQMSVARHEHRRALRDSITTSRPQAVFERSGGVSRLLRMNKRGAAAVGQKVWRARLKLDVDYASYDQRCAPRRVPVARAVRAAPGMSTGGMMGRCRERRPGCNRLTGTGNRALQHSDAKEFKNQNIVPPRSASASRETLYQGAAP